MRRRSGLLIFFAAIALLGLGTQAPRFLAPARPQAFPQKSLDDQPYCPYIGVLLKGAGTDPASVAARCLTSGISLATALADPTQPIDETRIDRADERLRFAEACFPEGSAGRRVAMAYRIVLRLYRQALTEGVTNRADWPHLSIANGCPSERSAFIVHGFSATPRQLKRQADFLVAHGFNVFTMRLSCHGGSARLLGSGRYRAWLADGETAYRVASLIGGAVYGFGNSMGGVIVLHVASGHPVAGVGVGAPALYLKNRLAETPVLDALAAFSGLPLAGRILPGVIFDDEFGYHTVPQPYSAILEQRKLARAVRRELRIVSFPLYAAWNAGDDTVDADRCVAFLGSLTATSPIALREYPGEGHTFWDVSPRALGGHVSVRDQEARMERYFRESVDFVQRSAEPGQ